MAIKSSENHSLIPRKLNLIKIEVPHIPNPIYETDIAKQEYLDLKKLGPTLEDYETKHYVDVALAKGHLKDIETIAKDDVNSINEALSRYGLIGINVQTQRCKKLRNYLDSLEQGTATKAHDKFNFDDEIVDPIKRPVPKEPDPIQPRPY